MKAMLLTESVKHHWSVQSPFRAPAQIPLHHADGGRDWTVNNFANEDLSGPDGTGTINLVEATIHSVNTVYAQAVVDVTPHNMANMAEILGLTGPNGGLVPSYPSIVLGTVDE